MLLIRDIVQENHRAADVGDVQIGWFPNHPFNAELAKRYMFTATAEAGKKSSTDVLKSIRDTFLFAQENRLTVIATYGHGKTHLALALANFFGKPYESPEVSDLLASIKHASSSLYEGFRTFKEDNAPMLVVRLQGNGSDSLPKLFSNALIEALTEAEPLIGKVALPFWGAQAVSFLQSLDGNILQKADTFLGSHNRDVPGFLAEIQGSGGTVGYDLCRALSQHLHGFPMDFGSEVSLDAAVKWVTDTFCGREKPFRGLLVLFDEFTVFVEKYAERRIGSNAGALQQLLDGIANARDAACLVAFSQVDPDEAAKRFFTQGGRGHSEGEKDLTKELTRLPKDKRFALHSSLERVLDTYLNQDMDSVASVANQTGDQFQDASDVTVQLLPRRYDYKEGWGTEEVYSVLTEGCFPLHPLTTGLLCTLQLREGTVTRSVLGAVRQALQECGDSPAVRTVKINGRSVAVPSWIYPTALVDMFGDMLTGDLTGNLYAQYERTLQNAGADATPAEQGVIKAVLLQLTANLTPLSHGPGGYAQLASHLCGLPPADCETALQDLKARYLLDKDPVKELFRFPQGGEGEQARKLEQEVERLGKEQVLHMLPLNEEWRKSGRLKEIPGQVRAGNASDYAAKEWLLTRKTFTAAMLRETVAKPFRIGAKSFENGERGAVVYLLARTDEDVAYFAQEVPRLLNEAFPATGGVPIPLVVGIPQVPRPKMLGRIMREKAFAAMQGADLNEYGTAAVQKVRMVTTAEVEAELKELRSEMKWVVPPAFDAAVNQNAARNDAAIKLGVCYGLAYADMPPAFKVQYGSGATNLRKAVKTLSEYLISGVLSKHQDTLKTSGDAMTRDIISDYLTNSGKSSSWGLVDMHGNPVASPGNTRIKKAWEHLDKAFEGSNPPPLVRDALLPLLNPPFGYDWNHATLLFCAWIGYRAKRVKFQEAGREKSVSDYLTLLARPDQFIQQMCDLPDLRLLQLDEQSQNKRIRGIIDTARNQLLTATEAQNYRADLIAFSQNTAMDAAVRDEAAKFADSLYQSLEQTKQYELVANTLLQAINRAITPSDVQAQLERIGSGVLPRRLHVKADAPDEATLRFHAVSRFKALIQKEAGRFSTLRHLEDYREFKNGLEGLIQHAIYLSDDTLRAELNLLIQQLENQRQALNDEREDRVLVEWLRMLRPATMPVAELMAVRGELKAKSARGAKAQELLDQTIENVEKSLEKATEFLQKFESDLDAANSGRRVAELKEQLLRQLHRYDDVSETTEQINSLQMRLVGLEDAFRVLERVPLRELNTPKELTAREEELCAARTLGSGENFLCAEQVQLFGKALEALHGKSKSETEKANEWIAKYEEKPPRDLAILDNPPPFLSAAGKKRLKVVRAKLEEAIQRRTDKDGTEAITRQFKLLSATQRLCCLEQLQTLVRVADEKERAA